MATALLFFILLTLSACVNDNSAEMPYLSVTNSDGHELNGQQIDISDAGGKMRVNIKSNYTWQAEAKAEWIELSPNSGKDDNSIAVTIAPTEESRSCAIAIYLTDYPQIRVSFNIIQHLSSSAPSDDDTQEPDTKPEDNPAQEPQQKPDTPPTEGPDDNTEQEPGEKPDEDNPNDENPSQNGEFIKISSPAQLAAGEYYIGGYQDGVLHLACGGMQAGHCKTAQYRLSESGDLCPTTELKATTVELETAADGGYYIHFPEGYLSATAAGAGKLVITTERSRYWMFSAHTTEGFIVRQSGEIDVQLIISRKAKDGALLRSVAGDEEGNAIILFRKNDR